MLLSCMPSIGGGYKKDGENINLAIHRFKLNKAHPTKPLFLHQHHPPQFPKTTNAVYIGTIFINKAVP